MGRAIAGPCTPLFRMSAAAAPISGRAGRRAIVVNDSSPDCRRGANGAAARVSLVLTPMHAATMIGVTASGD